MAQQQTTEQKYARKVGGLRDKLERRHAEVPADPLAIQSAEHALAAAELERDTTLAGERILAMCPNPNLAADVAVDTSPSAPPPAPRWLASTAVAAALRDEERRVQAARDRVIETERALSEATALGRRFPDSEQLRQQRIAARAALTEDELRLGESEGDLDARRQQLATPDVAEADRLAVEGCPEQVERDIASVVAEAQELGKRFGEALRRGYVVVDVAAQKRERAFAIAKRLGLELPKRPEEFARDTARYKVVRALRAGLEESVGSELYNLIESIARWVR
jgi:hypothetical protein